MLNLDELVTRLAVAARMVRLFTGASAVPVVTGREQVLVSVARVVPGRHVGQPATLSPRADQRRPRIHPRIGGRGVIHANAVRSSPCLESASTLLLPTCQGKRVGLASADADKAATAISREAERVRVIRLLVGGADED